jgi:hypothetical protein
LIAVASIYRDAKENAVRQAIQIDRYQAGGRMVAATPQNDRRWMALPRLIADRSCRAVVGLFFAVGAAMPAVSFAQTPQPGGTLTAIIQPEPVILTAAINTAAPTGTVSGNIFDGLVDYDASLNPQPALAIITSGDNSDRGAGHGRSCKLLVKEPDQLVGGNWLLRHDGLGLSASLRNQA